MYAVTVEILRSGQARHAHLSSYRGNLKNVMPVYYNIVVVPAVMVKTRIMCTYIYYTVVLVPGELYVVKSGNPNLSCLLRTIRASVELNSMSCLSLPFGGGP
jgi:hypothetical protein